MKNNWKKSSKFSKTTNFPILRILFEKKTQTSKIEIPSIGKKKINYVLYHA